MFLYIDNTNEESIIFFTSKDGKSWKENIKAHEKNGGLLIALDKLFEEEKIELKNLRGIAVKVGAGRFTSTRVVVTVANTLALVLKIPVISVKDIEMNSLKELIEKTPVGQYAHAVYSAEPRIGNK